MSRPASREQLKDWCLRQLGWPVMKINLDDDQIYDCIDEALQYFQDFHFDGVERWYLKHQITQDDVTNKYIPISDNIIGVTRIFSLISATNTSRNMFDFQYQMRLNDLPNLISTSFTSFAITMSHLRTIDLLFNGEQPVRFNRHSNRLYIDMNWEKVNVGEYFVVEGYIILDPNTYTDVYNDRMLKKLATQYIKRVWGETLKRYSGMQLPGGIQLNGQQIYNEAVEAIDKLESEIRLSHEEPPMMIIG